MPRKQGQAALAAAAAREAKRKKVQEKKQKKKQKKVVKEDDALILDQKTIRKRAKQGLLWSFMSLVPGTEAHRQATQSLMEMDDFPRLRREVRRSKAVRQLIHVGMHEQALDELLGEQTMDFQYWNRVKKQRIENGQWMTKERKKETFKDPVDGENRLKRGVFHDMELAKVPQYMKDMDAGPEVVDAAEEMLKAEIAARLADTSQEDDTGRDSTAEDQAGSSADSIEGKEASKDEELPGETKAGEVERRGEDGDTEELTEESTCAWVPVAGDVDERGWQCCNKVIRDPRSRALQRYCGFHVPECLHPHVGGDARERRIEIPNKHGLCTAHHIAVAGKAPKVRPFPLPGMKRRIKVRPDGPVPDHVLAPPGKYLPAPIHVARYTRPDPPEDILELATYFAQWARYKRRFRKFSWQSAVRIQAVWRQYQARLRFQLMKDKQQFDPVKRLRACVTIQALLRGWMLRTRIHAERERRRRAVLDTQRVVRGFLARRRAWKRDATIKIRRMFASIRLQAFEDAAVMASQGRKIEFERDSFAVQIQRIIRGFLARQFVTALLFEKQRELEAAIELQRHVRGFIARCLYHHLIYAVERHNWATWTIANALCRFLKASVRLKLQYRRLRATIAIQRVARGYVGRRRAEKMRLGRVLLWHWLGSNFEDYVRKEFIKEWRHHLTLHRRRRRRSSSSLSFYSDQYQEDEADDENTAADGAPPGIGDLVPPRRAQSARTRRRPNFGIQYSVAIARPRELVEAERAATVAAAEEAMLASIASAASEASAVARRQAEQAAAERERMLDMSLTLPQRLPRPGSPPRSARGLAKRREGIKPVKVAPHSVDTLDLQAQKDFVAVHQMAHTLHGMPRAASLPSLVEDRTVRPFVCAFPGCGRVFSTAQGLGDHQKVHRFKKRLVVPTPETDQFFSSHWPKEVPWRKNKEYRTAQIPDDWIVCPVAGCQRTFGSEVQLLRHVKAIHPRERGASFDDRNSSTVGGYVLVPPFDPPVEAPLHYCPTHDRAKPSCPMCADTTEACLLRMQPRQPVRYFSKMKVNGLLHHGRRGPATLDVAGVDVAVVLPDARAFREQQRGTFGTNRLRLGTPFGRLKESTATEAYEDKQPVPWQQELLGRRLANAPHYDPDLVRIDTNTAPPPTAKQDLAEQRSEFQQYGASRTARLLALCQGADKTRWAAVQYYLTPAEARREAVPNMPSGCDPSKELVLDEKTCYVRIGAITGWEYVYRCSRHDYETRRRAGVLPDPDAKFCRPTNREGPYAGLHASARTSENAPQRSVRPLSPIASLPKPVQQDVASATLAETGSPNGEEPGQSRLKASDDRAETRYMVS